MIRTYQRIPSKYLHLWRCVLSKGNRPNQDGKSKRCRSKANHSTFSLLKTAHLRIAHLKAHVSRPGVVRRCCTPIVSRNQIKNSNLPGGLHTGRVKTCKGLKFCQRDNC